MLLALCFLVAPLLAQEVEVPENDGWVTDLAHLLDPQQERALESLMESYRSGSQHEIALLTVPSLGGVPIERFALEVGRAWKIGGKEANDGALLVVAKDDRKIRIEVGRGLEGNLTDSISGRIIRDVISPAFRRGDFYGGIQSGIEAMQAAAGGDYGPIERTREARRDQGGIAMLVTFFVIAMVLGGLGRRARFRGSRGGGGGLWSLLWLATMLGNHGGHHRGGRRGGGGGGFGGFGGGGFGGGGGGFGGFGGGGGFSGGGASGGW